MVHAPKPTMTWCSSGRDRDLRTARPAEHAHGGRGAGGRLFAGYAGTLYRAGQYEP